MPSAAAFLAGGPAVLKAAEVSKSFCNDGLSCPDCKKEYSRTHLEKQFAGRRKDYEWVISYLCDCGATLSIIRQPATYKIAVAT